MKDPCPNPCADCPWRKDSLPGFLGGAELEDFVLAWEVEKSFPCHNTVTDSTTWDSQWRWCTGYLIARKNDLSLPRNPQHARAVDLVEADENVVSGISGFIQHHKRWEP